MSKIINNLIFNSKDFLKNLTSDPGVYRMYGSEGNLLYVGKAKNLNKRLSSYFNRELEDKRISIMVRQIDHIEITVVRSEAEALVLESALIRTQKPKYNIALRDHKGYPYIFISNQDSVPKIKVSYGKKEGEGVYFGPFPSPHSVRSSVDFLQKYFKLRTCDDVFYANRTRPCLEYQIGRCTAPCVGLINLIDYRQRVDDLILFLQGKSEEIFKKINHEMQKSSLQLDFEKAANLRDQITHLRRVQEKVAIEIGVNSTDIVVVSKNDINACVCVLFIKENTVSGSKSYKIPLPLPSTDQDILSEFLAQYLLSGDHPVARSIVLEDEIDNIFALEGAFFANTGNKISITHSSRKLKEQINIAKKTAQAGLEMMNTKDILMQRRWSDLERLIGFNVGNKILECFDISHTQGQDTIASCVSMGEKGLIKSRYRKYNISDITPGDDYAAMYQALFRRFKDKKNLPGILIVDGGQGQVTQAIKALKEKDINIPIIGISKGPDRKAGEEDLVFSWTGESIKPGSDSPALHLIAHIRDEAHRFAITGHRKKRDKRAIRSTLEDIEGIGPSKRKSILVSFGGIEGVRQATLEQLEKAPGIGKQLASRIYEQLHR